MARKTLFPSAPEELKSEIRPLISVSSSKMRHGIEVCGFPRSLPFRFRRI